MIVAVVAVRMMETAFDQVVEMVAVRNLVVSATIVLTGTGRRRTMIWVRLRHCQNVFVVMAVVRAVQAAIVQIIDMTIVLDARMAAMFAVDVLVIVVNFVGHRTFLLWNGVVDFIGPPHIRPLR